MENFSKKKISVINSLRLNNLTESKVMHNSELDEDSRVNPHLPLLNALRKQLAESAANFDVIRNSITLF